MNTKKYEAKKLWVYSNGEWITRKHLVFCVNDVESWYEEPSGWPTYDPFHVAESKEALIERLTNWCNEQLNEHMSETERLTRFIKKLTRKV